MAPFSFAVCVARLRGNTPCKTLRASVHGLHTHKSGQTFEETTHEFLSFRVVVGETELMNFWRIEADGRL